MIHLGLFDFGIGGVVLGLIAMIVFLYNLDKYFNKAKERSRQKKAWIDVNSGICPWCGEKTIGKFTEIHCSRCSFSHPKQVLSLNNCCSFCGTELTIRKQGETVGHDEKERVIYRSFLGCPQCKGWVNQPNFSKSMIINDGKCGFCQGPLKTIQEKKVELNRTTYAIMECEDCGRTGVDSPPPEPAMSNSYEQDDSYDWRPGGIGSI